MPQAFKNPLGATFTNSFTASPSDGTTITASGSTNTKGSWTELIASTTHDSYGFYLKVAAAFTAATDVNILLDIGIGAASSEVVLFPDYLVGGRSDSSNMGYSYFVPLFIAKGTRVSSRIQSNVASRTAAVSIVLVEGTSDGRPIYRACDAYGLDTSTSSGTIHTPGGSGAESTDANVGSTLSKDYDAIMLGVQVNLATQASRITHWELRVSSTTLMEWTTGVTTSEFIYGPIPNTAVPIKLKSGTQLQIRAENNNSGEALEAAYYCFY